jgi:DNA processing protein
MTRGPLSDAERRDWLRLSKSENVGPATFKSLLKRFRTAGAALEALPGLARKGGLGRAPRLYGREAAERDMANAAALKARFIAEIEPDYPALLREVEGAPPMLCVKGDTSLLARSGVAIVGARNASAVARRFTRQLGVGDRGRGPRHHLRPRTRDRHGGP